jgi:anti-sigma factor RsiW
MVEVTCGNRSEVCADQESALEVAGRLLAETGLSPSDLRFEDRSVTKVVEPSEVEKALEKGVSEFGQGNQVVDEEARARISSVQADLKGAGFAVSEDRQLYGIGVRMAQVGYENQDRRAHEHAAKQSIVDACHALSERTKSEHREDITISAGELAKSVEVNGALKVRGYKLTEQAVRGLCSRLESPATRYVVGLRERIVQNCGIRDGIALEVRGQGHDAKTLQAKRYEYISARSQVRLDKVHLAETIRRELLARPDVELKLRARNALGDIFAVVSPSYTPADAPEVIAQVVDHLPAGAKGTWSYDPDTTAWELRADVWTPVPLSEQAVGEPFRASATFFGRDNGTGRFGGGGTIELLACLNAGTYVANGAQVSRVHRANVLVDVEAVLAGALKAVDIMADAWGIARESVVEAPAKITINDAIPGFWRYLLTDRRSELSAVLPGRSEAHVEKLVATFDSERRDRSQIVRADFAQAWTKQIQSQPANVRREAERAVGDFLVSGRPVRYLAKNDDES